jgi:hypothetical protein
MIPDGPGPIVPLTPKPQPEQRLAGSNGFVEMLSALFPFGKGGGAKAAAEGAKEAGAFAGLGKAARIGGAVALPLAAIATAANELNNPDLGTSDQQRVLNAAGAGGGTLVGGGLGAALGGALTLGNPLGVLAGGAIGSFLGDTAGKGLAGIMGPTPEEKVLASQMKAAQAQTEAEKYRLQTLMPIQQDIARLAIANEVQRAAALTPIEAQRQRDAAFAQSLLAAQHASNQQALAATQGLFSRGII